MTKTTKHPISKSLLPLLTLTLSCSAIARGENKIFVGDYLNRRLSVYQLVNTDQEDGLPADPAGAATPPGQ